MMHAGTTEDEALGESEMIENADDEGVIENILNPG